MKNRDSGKFDTMNKLPICIESFCPKELSAEYVKDQLGSSTLDWENISAGKTASIGILIVDPTSSDLFDKIHQRTENGSRRLLVLMSDKHKVSRDTFWNILDAGASDILVWPLDNEKAVIPARLKRWAEIDAKIDKPEVQENLVGKSKVWKNTLRQIVEIALFAEKEPILLTGKTGTGKEMVARFIHSLDEQRSNHPFVIVDCTNIVPELLGSELFGHERGAFTGAISSREGAFALANGGTLFLDEVGELGVELQIQLLRVLQEHTYKRVGSNSWQHTDFRLICATNRDIFQEQAKSIFRRDLYYRIASWTIRLPSLDERADDIPLLVKHFMSQSCGNSTLPELDDRVQEYLLSRLYPGNVRDLKSLVARIMSRHVAPGPITLGDIPPNDRPTMDDVDLRFRNTLEKAIRLSLLSGVPLQDLKSMLRDTTFRMAVEFEEGNLQRAAERLRVSERTLQQWRAKQGTP